MQLAFAVGLRLYAICNTRAAHSALWQLGTPLKSLFFKAAASTATKQWNNPRSPGAMPLAIGSFVFGPVWPRLHFFRQRIQSTAVLHLRNRFKWALHFHWHIKYTDIFWDIDFKDSLRTFYLHSNCSVRLGKGMYCGSHLRVICYSARGEAACSHGRSASSGRTLWRARNQTQVMADWQRFNQFESTSSELSLRASHQRKWTVRINSSEGNSGV